MVSLIRLPERVVIAPEKTLFSLKERLPVLKYFANANASRQR